MYVCMLEYVFLFIFLLSTDGYLRLMFYVRQPDNLSRLGVGAA